MTGGFVEMTVNMIKIEMSMDVITGGRIAKITVEMDMILEEKETKSTGGTAMMTETDETEIMIGMITMIARVGDPIGVDTAEAGEMIDVAEAAGAGAGDLQEVTVIDEQIFRKNVTQ